MEEKEKLSCILVQGNWLVIKDRQEPDYEGWFEATLLKDGQEFPVQIRAEDISAEHDSKDPKIRVKNKQSY